MTRKQDTLLEALAADLRPVGSDSVARRFALWGLLVAVLVVIVGRLVTRPGLLERFGQPDFLLQFSLWLAVVVAAGGSAFILATPRWPMVRGIRLATGLLLLSLIGYGTWLMLRLPVPSQGVGDGSSEMPCMMIVSSVGLITAAFMVLALRGRAKPTYPWLMALMMAIAGAGTGMLAIMLVCPHEEAGHVLVSHFLPALAVGLLVTFAGKRWWRW